MSKLTCSCEKLFFITDFLEVPYFENLFLELKLLLPFGLDFLGEDVEFRNWEFIWNRVKFEGLKIDEEEEGRSKVTIDARKFREFVFWIRI